jgi:hypothetical protein
MQKHVARCEERKKMRKFLGEAKFEFLMAVEKIDLCEQRVKLKCLNKSLIF